MSDNAEKRQRKKRNVSEKSLANLKPFEKGKSGNPKGMEVGTIQNKTRLLRMLENAAPDMAKELPAVVEFGKGLSAITSFDALNARLLYKAIVEGDMAAIKEIFDRIEGKPAQALDVTSNGETINWVALSQDAKTSANLTDDGESES